MFADDEFRVLVNPTGKFELGGPHAVIQRPQREIHLRVGQREAEQRERA